MSLRSASPSDGEIASGDEEKAISTTMAQKRDSEVNPSTRPTSSSRALPPVVARNPANDVDFHFRDDDGVVRYHPHRDGSRSPYQRGRERSRSPYRTTKGAVTEKRRHEDDHYLAKGGSDKRRFKIHYEDGQPSRELDHHHPRLQADVDGSAFSRDSAQYPDRKSGDRPAGRARDRSRSPFRHRKAESVGERQALSHNVSTNTRGSSRAKELGSSARPNRLGGVSSHERDSSPRIPHAHKNARSQRNVTQLADFQSVSEDTQSNEASNGTTEADEEQVHCNLSEAEIIEQRRKRREAIKAKHKSQPPLLIQALEQNLPSAPATPAHDSSGIFSEQHSPPSSLNSPRTPHQDSPPDSPAAFSVDDDEELANQHQKDSMPNDEDGPSAAEYDPNMDMQEDRPDHKRIDVAASSVNLSKSAAATIEPETVLKASNEFDMFADDGDDDDMFAPANNSARPASGSKQAKTLDQSLLDNWDYPDGHYRINLGELLDGRYAVQQQIGKGTFATVVRAQDVKTGNAVAIKIACNNETMFKAGQKEMDMLALLNQHDADDKKHIIRMERHFIHKGHLCLVFENLSADLREVLKKFGRNVGLNLKAIRSYAQQMFLALGHMKKCQILHADLKPDNILVSEKRNLLKICDLGTATFAHDAEITPYLVSRFYRAPEVILGMPFDYAIDMWSIGCTLFELYTGRILFAGADNNSMLRVIQECRGKFPIRMLKRSSLADRHFDVEGTFFSQERDKLTGKVVARQVNFNKTISGKDLRSRLSGNAKGLAPAELREHAAFADLMDKCLQLDPARRISPSDALRHAFIAHNTSASTTSTAASHRVKPALAAPRVR